MEDNQIESALNSVIGKKVTIVKFGEMGFPQTIKTVITKVFRGDYAQYRNCLQFHHKPKGKRTQYVQRFTYATSFVLWEGWHEVNTEMFVEVIPAMPGTLEVQKSRTCFDPQYIADAVKSVSVAPIIQIQK